MPVLYVPDQGGGRRAVTVPAGQTLLRALRELGLTRLAVQRGLEIRTATGWGRASPGRVLREGDQIRMATTRLRGRSAGSAAAEVFAALLQGMRRKQDASRTSRSGLRGRRHSRRRARTPTKATED